MKIRKKVILFFSNNLPLQIWTLKCSLKSFRPAISPDLGRRLSAFSLHCRLTGFEVHFTGEIENLLAFVLFQIDYFIIYGNQISIRYCRS